jgi:hypothetical protein
MNTEQMWDGGDRYVTYRGRRMLRFAGGEAAGAPAAVQPEAQPPTGGQGDPGQGGDTPAEGLGLYDLSDAPEELRPYLEQELKKIEGNVTKRFQEHADFREQLGPLADIDGLSEVPADELSELIEFRQIASDPEQFEAWWNTIGENMKFFADDEEGEGGEPGDEFGDFEEGGEPEYVGEMREKIAELEARLGETSERQEEQSQQQRVDAAIAKIQTDLEALPHGETDPEKVEAINAAVVKLAHAYPDDDDAIAKAFADWQQISGTAQGDLVDRKLGQPQAALSGGTPDASQPKLSFLDGDDPKTAAKARLAAGG